MKRELEKIAYVYGDVCLRKQRRKRQKLLITDLLLDYAKNSTLHGLRYIAEKGLTTIEKLFWITTFVISIVLCSFLIKNVYVKWRTSPVIVTVSERLVSVSEIPFPSVTICPQIKSKASVYNLTKEIDVLTKNFGNASEEELFMFEEVSMVCGFRSRAIINMQYRELLNTSFMDVIDHVSPNTSDVFAVCSWHDTGYLCNNLFKKVYTAEGLCFNMNGLAAEEMFRDTVQSDFKYSERDEVTKGWSMQDGYSKALDDVFDSNSKTLTDVFPRRGSDNGANPDLEVLLFTRTDDSDGICNGLNSGYKIYIQHPTDFPQSSMYYYAALDGQVSSLALSFNVLNTDENLKKYPSETRQCYFQEDRSLRYFKIYTAKNCRAECLSNYTYTYCNCVGYYMPHDNSSQICAESKLDCMLAAHQTMAKVEFILESSPTDEGCRCLPACNSVEYDAEVLKTEFHLKRYLNKVYTSLGRSYSDYFDNTTKFSKFEIYYKKPKFVSMRRSELFGLTDFLANIGGLLGVFLGFSFLSFIEILYFVTLRVGCLLRRDLKEEKINRSNIKVVKVT